MNRFLRITPATVLSALLGALTVPAGAPCASPEGAWVIGAVADRGVSSIAAARQTPGGTLLYVLDKAPGGSLDSPAICMDGAGRAAAVWVRRGGDINRILVSSFDGESWTPPAEVESSRAYLSTPSLSLAQDASLWIAWAFQNGEADDIRALRWRAGAGEHAAVFGHPDHPDLAPAISPDGAGGAVLLWKGCDGSVYRWLRAEFGNGGWSGGVPAGQPLAAGRMPAAATGTAPGGEIDSLAAALRKMADEAGLARQGLPGAAWSADGKLWSAPLPQAGEGREPLPAEEGTTILSRQADRTFILGIGDSTTYGRGSTFNGPPTDYLSRLQGMLKGPWLHINRGIPGDDTTGILNRMDTELADHPAGLVILSAGINDAYNGFNPSATVANLHLSAHKALARGAKVLLCTTPPVQIGMEVQYLRLQTLNPMIAAMASDNGFPLVDLWTVFQNKANWEMRFIDPLTGIHPNDMGYELMAARIRAAVLRRGLLLGDLRWRATGPLLPGQLDASGSVGTAEHLLDPYTALADNDITAVAAIDPDGDGVDSLAVVRSTRTLQTLTIYRAPAAGTSGESNLLAEVLVQAESDWIGLTSGWITHLFAIDLDADGRDEIGLMRYRSGTQVMEIWRAHQPGGASPVRLVRDEWLIPSKGRVKDIAAIQADADPADEVAVLTEAYIGGEQGLLVLDTPPEGADSASANNEPVLYSRMSGLPSRLLQVAGQDISDPADGRDELLLLRSRGAGRKDLLAAYALPELPAADGSPLTMLARDRWVRIQNPDVIFFSPIRLSDGAGGIVPALSFWINP